MDITEVRERRQLVVPPGSCGFCSTHGRSARHDLCPRVVFNANPERTDRKWICPCWQANPEPHLEPGAYVPEDLFTPRPRS